MEIPLIKDISIIFSLSIVVLLICYRIRIHPLVGLIVTGVISGPHGAGLVSASEQVDVLAKIGIILLLFSIGMEFSPRRMMEMKRLFFLGGILQVGLTALFGFLVGQILQRPMGESVFLGFLLSLSSTAIGLKILSDRSECTAPHGRVMLAILIFQDIMIVPMVLLTPALSGLPTEVDTSLFWLILKAFAIIVAAFIVADKVVPKLMFFVARTQSRELFLLTLLALCFSVAWMASIAGLTLSLGAFLAGMILSESEYRHHAIGHILPFQDIFTSFFFISIGMLLDIHYVTDHPFLIIGITFAVIVMKASVAGFATYLIGMPLRTMIYAGLGLCQVGEFAFVLARAGMQYNIGTPDLYQIFLSVSLISMILTPFLMQVSPHIAKLAMQLPLPDRMKLGLRQFSPGVEQITKKDHVIIIGCGVAGRNLAWTCRNARIEYVILDINPDIVRREKAKGEPIYFGDASHSTVLKQVNIEQARAVALLIGEIQAERVIVEAIRNIAPDVYILARTHNLSDADLFTALGANDVVVEEFEMSVEVFSRLLRRFMISQEEVDRFANQVRGEEYKKTRSEKNPFMKFFDLDIDMSGLAVDAYIVESNSPLIGNAILDSKLREKWGLTVLAIRREDKNLHPLSPQTQIKEGDKLVLFGSRDQLQKVKSLFRPKNV